MINDDLLSRPLAWDDAQRLRNDRVELFPDDESPASVALRVVEVASKPESRGMRQFSIVFRGPPDPVYPQRMYRFRHAILGDYAIFITPIARTAEGTDYEACFAHAA